IVDGEPITIIGATLNAPNHLILARDVKTLLNEAKQGFKTITLAKKQQVFATYKTPWSTAHAITEKSYKLVVWPGQSMKEHVNVKSLRPGPRPTVVRSATFQYADERLIAPFQPDKVLSLPSWLWRLTRPTNIISYSCGDRGLYAI